MTSIRISPRSEQTFYADQVAKHGAPLLLLDCDRVRQQYRNLCSALPGVEHYYAIKSLPHPDLLATLAAEGAAFDVASSGELELLRNLHFTPRRTIHTHPIKRDRDIRAALRFGCTSFVVDNIDELSKFVPYRHRVGLLLRIGFQNRGAVVDLARKFGCALEDVELLLQEAQRLGIHIKGLSFHVGSQCATPDAHVEAIRACGRIIQRYDLELGGHPLGILDIGGGFPVPYAGGPDDIENFCAPIREAIAELPHGISVIAEPGRYISAPAMTSVSSVMGRARRNDRTWYYLDDGVYGSFSGRIYDHASYPLEIFSDSDRREPCVLAGPTCDSIDVLAEDVELPQMEIGDLVVGHLMGAYTMATATDFNSFDKARVVVLNGGNYGLKVVSG
jgi:ornithine decarboxylase